MHTIFYFLVIFLLLFQVSCKKKNDLINPFVSYVVGNSTVSLYEKPNFSSKIIQSLNQNSEFKILEKEIPDSANKKLGWFKIEFGNVTAYMSQVEREKNHISIFDKENSQEPYYVRATSLRLRKSPTLTGEIITNLPNNAQVTVLEKAQNSEEIDGKYDYWVKVKTQDNKIGFCYRGYLISGLNPEWKEEAVNGYMVVKNVSSLLNEPAGAKAESSQERPNFFDRIKEGDILPVYTKATVNGKTYYQVNDSFENAEIGSCEVCGIIQFWIEASQVDYIGASVADYTKEKFGFENEKLFQSMKAKNGNRFDVRNIKVKPLGTNTNGVAFLYVELNTRTPINSKPEMTSYKVYQEVNGEYSELFSQNASADIHFYDFDKNGIEEFSINHYGRMTSLTDYYAILNGKPTKILSLEEGEFPDGGESSEYLSSEVNDDKIIVYKSNGNEEKDKKVQATYVFKNDKFVKM